MKTFFLMTKYIYINDTKKLEQYIQVEPLINAPTNHYKG